jgi:hypothetical protein
VLDEKSFELLNAEIDGELSPADRAELSRRLLESPELRSVREELRLACAELERCPQVEPPAGLREKILAAFPQATQGGPTEARSRLGFALSPRTLRFAAAVVGGVLVSAIAFQASRNVDGVGAGDVTGTMASSAAVAAGAGTLRVDATRVRGTVTLTPSAGELRVRFDFDPSQPQSAVPPEAIDVVVIRGREEIQLQKIAAAQQVGGTAYEAALTGRVAAGEVVNVRVLASEVPVYEGRWQASSSD